MSECQRAIVISGPTGSGKSKFGLMLAQRLSAEIVNGDSVQCYRDFLIGSCAPSKLEQGLVPHHLFSQFDPLTPLDAQSYATHARNVVNQLSCRGATPVIVGGTMLYLQSLINGLSPIAKVSDEAQRLVDEQEHIWRSEERDNLGELFYQWLSSEDISAASKIHPRDTQRVRRALLVKLSSGDSIMSHHQRQNAKPRLPSLVVVLHPERHTLYDNINRRTESMFDAGLVDEVTKLSQRYPLSVRPFGAIGYRHALLLLEGSVDEEEMLRQLKRDTRRYAKRQISWWHTQPQNLGWVSLLEEPFKGEPESLSDSDKTRVVTEVTPSGRSHRMLSGNAHDLLDSVERIYKKYAALHLHKVLYLKIRVLECQM